MNIVECAHTARQVFPTVASLAAAQERDAAADAVARDDDDDDEDDGAAGAAAAAATDAAAVADDGDGIASPPVHGQLPFASPRTVTPGSAAEGGARRKGTRPATPICGTPSTPAPLTPGVVTVAAAAAAAAASGCNQRRGSGAAEGWATAPEMQREYDSVTCSTKHPTDLVTIGAQEPQRVNGRG